jgi:hypothetical protein
MTKIRFRFAAFGTRTDLRWKPIVHHQVKIARRAQSNGPAQRMDSGAWPHP